MELYKRNSKYVKDHGKPARKEAETEAFHIGQENCYRLVNWPDRKVLQLLKHIAT